MTLHDRDLRDALAPLLGDPVADAARVLAALPPGGPGGPNGKPLPPLTWWLLGSGLVLGAVLGLWLGRGQAPAAAQEPPAKTTPAKAEEPVQPALPAPREELLFLTALGRVHVDEPGAAPRDLAPGAWAAPLGTTVTTDATSQAGLHLLGDDARIHLDHATVATVAAGEVRLRSGRVWVGSGAKDVELRVVSDLATILFTHAEVTARRRDEGLLVVAVSGAVSVRTPAGQTAQLAQGSQVLVDPDRGIGASEKVPSLAAATNWLMGQGPKPDEEHLYLMAFGRIHIDEPGAGSQDLEPGQWNVAPGTTVTTDARSQAGLLVYADDSRVRLDNDTAATVTAGDLRLKSGRIWVGTGARDTEIRIESDLATIMFDRGDVVAIREPEGLAVIALNGETIVRTKGGQTAKLNRGLQVFVDPNRGLSSVQKAAFTGTVTSWMTDMIVMGLDETELKARVNDMVDAFMEGSQRAAAAHELRKLGPRCTGPLVESIGKRPLDPDYARAAAALAADVADYRSTAWLFQLLAHDDAEVRVLAFRGIVRATATDGGTDETLWRNGSIEKREAAIAAWWKSLK